jgi:uncharacterized protein YndB with AHSA1/START domain
MQNVNPQTLAQLKEKDNELLYIRELKAPRELVFEVWTKSEHLSQWWGPTGFTLTTEPMVAVTGGSWKFTMHGPDGTNFPNKINFIEVRKPERIIYKHSGEAGTENVSFTVTVLFEPTETGTRLTMNMVFETAAELQRVAREYGAIEGAVQHLDRLATYTYSL